MSSLSYEQSLGIGLGVGITLCVALHHARC